MTDQTAGLVSCQTTQLPHTRSAECANATEFRRVPTMAERLTDSRLSGHTPEQHRHDDGQAADARSQDRRIRELEAELARERARADRTDDALFDARYTIDQVLSDKNTALARANHVATELGHALDLIAEVRNNRERDDRALAAYDTRPSKPAASVTITLDNSKGTFTPRHPGDALADALRNAYDTEQLATLHERTVDQLDDDAPREDPLGRLVDALFAARWHQQPPSSVPPRRAQEQPAALPAWVLDLVRGLDRYELEHPTLYRQNGDGTYGRWPCPEPLLALVPAEARRQAEVGNREAHEPQQVLRDREG